MNWIISSIIIFSLIYGFSGNSDSINNYSYDEPTYTENSYYPTSNNSFNDSYDGYDEHTEDINRYESLGGTYTVEACNTRTGSCYDLDADIGDGSVERIYFPNGGHLDLDGAELDEYGYATGESYTYGEGYNGDEWEINCYNCE